MIRKADDFPHEENMPFFILFVARNAFVILALGHYSITTVLFRLSVVAVSPLLLVIVAKPSNRNLGEPIGGVFMESKMRKRRLRGVSELPEGAVFDDFDSPVGNLTIVTSSQGLHSILWDSDLLNPQYQKVIYNLDKSTKGAIMNQVKQQLNEYFAGERTTFDLPVILQGTPFQTAVWKELVSIPYAQTVSYGELAIKLGDRNKARAVGMANGLKPISIVVPCHRVIGGNGALVGFGGGLDKKATLLTLEEEMSKEQRCSQSYLQQK